MLIVIIRTFIILALVFFFIRLMGKRQIGEMQPIELVMTLIIAEVACVPMSDLGIPLIYGLIPIATLFCIHFVLSYFSRKSLWFRAAVDGKSVTVIDDNGINYKALKKLNMNINDLLEAVRGQGYHSLSEIKFAMFETNGTLYVIPHIQNEAVTCADLKIKKEQTSMAVSFIIDGKIINLNLLKADKKKIQKILKKYGFNSEKEILLATTDKSGNVYIQPKNGKFITDTVKDLKISA